MQQLAVTYRFHSKMYYNFEKIGSRKLAELLYTDDVEGFIQELQNEVDFSVRLDNKNDSDGFFKAVFEKEPYTLAICDIVEQKK